MKSFLFIVVGILISSILSAQTVNLVGEWSGPGKIDLRKNGSGYISTGMCSFEIEWSSTLSELTFHYIKDPECSYNDSQVGYINKKMHKPKKDDTVRYKISKSKETGFEAWKLTIFSRTAPNGVTYFRPLSKEERGSRAGAGLSRKECRKEISEQTRACDSKGGTELEVMVCKNTVIVNHLDCI